MSPTSQNAPATAAVLTAEDVRCIAVVGAGQMGSGIAHVAAVSGYDVVLTDISEDALDRARASIARNLSRQVKKERLTQGEADAAVARIDTSVSLEPVSVAQLVIEAATESREIKARIFGQLAAHMAPEAVLASNTSSISITELAARSDRPERFMGMHFMNPVPVMKLVELIRGLATSDATAALVTTVAERMGKTTVMSQRDVPGFIVNRVLMPYINEAVQALYEGVATVEDIDTAMKLGTNVPMGPLTLADFIGLDTCLAIMEVLQAGFGDKYTPCPLLRNYVDAGWHGRKTGRGFYTYPR
jgi:3-hydroxybutyryl-CoA dehydrogenase